MVKCYFVKRLLCFQESLIISADPEEERKISWRPPGSSGKEGDRLLIYNISYHQQQRKSAEATWHLLFLLDFPPGSSGREGHRRIMLVEGLSKQ